ncbi:MAG: hypothetical protein P1P69_07070 [Methanosarcinaceae archaeon]|nr:hypothetical protein [Methanosarcinaceae archaeon]
MNVLTHKQRILLKVIEELYKKGTSSKFMLVKNLFLLYKETNIEYLIKFYHFYPYKYGPFSNECYTDLGKLERAGFVVEEGKRLMLTEKGMHATSREKVKMPIEFRYIFKCKDEPECTGHKIILIDWELNELPRNIMRKDKDPDVIKEKIKNKLFDHMKTRDLYFFMGTHFRFGTWIIIGIFYPPQPEKLVQKTLFDI